MRAGIRAPHRNTPAQVLEHNCLVTAGGLSCGFVFQFVMLPLAFLTEKELVLKSVSC